MTAPDWPTPSTDPQQPQPQAPQQPAQRALPLPRVDDLPVAEQGYDREAVREAFDAFYRHAAQLDATLRTLEAVEVFQRTASELRAELRTVRAAGWTTGGAYGGGGYGAARSSVREWSLPPAFPRVAAEALFLIVIGVIVGVAGWSRIAIVLVMALALGIVWLVEWVASRERAIPQAAAPPAPPPKLDEEVDEDVPVELAAGDAAGWSAFSQAEEGPEAMTMISAAEEVPVEAAEQVALEDPVPVEPPVDDDPVPVEEPPDEDPVPVDEPAEEDELVAEVEPVIDVEEAGEAPAPEPVGAEVEHVEEDQEEEEAAAATWPFASDPAPHSVVDEQPRRRFRLWRRHKAASETAVAEPDSDPELETRSHEPLEAATEPEASASEEEFLERDSIEPELVTESYDEPERVDPWEREPELPAADADVVADDEPNDEHDAPDGHAAAVEDPPEPEEEPRRGWFRRTFSSAVVDPGREHATDERELVPELLDAAAEADELEPEPDEPEPEAAAGLEDADVDEGEDEDVEEDEEDEEPRDPVELLAEQAEAALARSRARRRPARRARRR